MKLWPMSRMLVLVTCLLLLEGCAGLKSLGVARAGPGSEFSSEELKAFRENQEKVLGELVSLAQTPAGPPPTWDNVIAAGMDYADSRCETYMHALFRLNRDRKTLSSQVGLIGAATAGVMAAVDSAARDVAVVAILFGLTSSTIDNLSSNILYELDPSSVRTLVKSLQGRYRQELQNGYNSRPAALSVIRSYAEICIPSNIEAEVNLAVKRAQPQAAPGDPGKGQPPAVSVGTPFSSLIDDNTTILRNFVFAGGTLNDANRDRLEQFMQSRNIYADIPSFIRLEKYAKDRADAVNALGVK